MPTEHADSVSVFSYEGGGSDSFSLSRLSDVVSKYLGTPCALVKIDEGGSHKVYDVISRTSSKSLDTIVRVASPAFPKDKMLSEPGRNMTSRQQIATLKYIAAHTPIPVPQVYMWDADASNPVGAEYMVMQKIPGIAPHDNKWKSLPLAVKLNVVGQVAEHLATLSSLQFERAGSLYPSTDDPRQFKVGPIVSLPFYHMVDGVVEHPDMPPNVRVALNALRGPFVSASDYLASYLEATLLKANLTRQTVPGPTSPEDPVSAHENAHEVARLALELCRSYPGDRSVPWPISTPRQPFTIMLDDFRLANILIDEATGRINGYIDFEATTVVPFTNWYGGTPEDQRALWRAFHTTIDRHDHALTGGEWRKAYELGKPFRHFADRLCLDLEFWDEEMEAWIKMVDGA
ncbi:hypothetical protein FRC10_005055 [Ceratobasidium sp. 414]|nr:hypothetical protein FRC10_005055 [Ceratobasidium sp. 414]